MIDKLLIYNSLKDSIEQKINELSQSIAQVEESRNLETKSSVGDKYETGRAMAQNEIDRLSQQMSILREQKNLLNLIKPEVANYIVGMGSLINTDKGWFYISIGYGQIQIEGETVFCLSAGSPLGQELINKEVGDHVDFNGRGYTILDMV